MVGKEVVRRNSVNMSNSFSQGVNSGSSLSQGGFGSSSGLNTGSSTSSSAGWSEQKDVIIEPHEFRLFKTGGIENNCLVEYLCVSPAITESGWVIGLFRQKCRLECGRKNILDCEKDEAKARKKANKKGNFKRNFYSVAPYIFYFSLLGYCYYLAPEVSKDFITYFSEDTAKVILEIYDNDLQKDTVKRFFLNGAIIFSLIAPKLFFGFVVLFLQTFLSVLPRLIGFGLMGVKEVSKINRNS